MLEIVRQSAKEFELLTAMQAGWDFNPMQLSRYEEPSQANLIRADDVGFTEFRLNVTYDQRLHARPGYYTFGILQPDCSTTWLGNQTIQSNALIVFPREEDMAAISHKGFHANGLHFRASYLEFLVQDLYGIQLDSVLPPAGMIELPPLTHQSLRKTMQSWREMESYQDLLSPATLLDQQEALAICVLEGMLSGSRIERTPYQKGDISFDLALDYIHNQPVDSFTAADLCREADCSQRWLEQCFKKRFGITPKKYVKVLRLARVRENLLKADKEKRQSIIELASEQGFWHMGQFAADYRKLYGELPSESLGRLSSSGGSI